MPLSRIFYLFLLRTIFSNILKYFRISANLRQEDLAEKVELTDKYISDLERAKFSPSKLLKG